MIVNLCSFSMFAILQRPCHVLTLMLVVTNLGCNGNLVCWDRDQVPGYLEGGSGGYCGPYQARYSNACTFRFC